MCITQNATLKIMSSSFLTAEWRKLLMANYPVEEEVLRPYLPYGTEFDYWEGKLYMSLVGFMFLNTKVLGIPVPFHRHFEEVNLRFYVRYKAENEWRRGVVFLRELVPKTMIAFVANTVYGEHYRTLPMRHNIEQEADSLRVEYGWKTASGWSSFGAVCAAQAQEMPEGSEAEFITEHYWGYTRLGDRKTSQYQVEHPRWQVYPVLEHRIKVDFEQTYGKALAPYLQTEPASLLCAEGSPIRVRKGARIRG